MRYLQILHHPPLVTDFDGLIDIAIDIGNRTGGIDRLHVSPNESHGIFRGKSQCRILGFYPLEYIAPGYGVITRIKLSQCVITVTISQISLRAGQ